MTRSSAKILLAFLSGPQVEHYGFALMRETGVKAGSLYPILRRLERAGWIEGEDEDIDEAKAGRPRRRLYRLTELGELEAQAAVVDFYEDLGVRPPGLPSPKERV